MREDDRDDRGTRDCEARDGKPFAELEEGRRANPPSDVDREGRRKGRQPASDAASARAPAVTAVPIRHGEVHPPGRELPVGDV